MCPWPWSRRRAGGTYCCRAPTSRLSLRASDLASKDAALSRSALALARTERNQDRNRRWRVSLITATPAKFIDFTMAPDAETAEEQVAQAYDIDATLRHRLVAIREDW